MGSFEVSGRWLIIIGLSIAAAGGLIWLAGRYLGWKQIPGTLRLDGQGFSCVFPVLGSILLSILLTILINLTLRFLDR